MWAISLHLNTASFMGSMPVLFHLYCVLLASYAFFFCSSNSKRGSAKELLDLRSCIWHQSPSSLRIVSIASFPLTSLFPYFINPPFFQSVLIMSLTCKTDGKLMPDEAGWKRKTRTTISKRNFAVSFQGNGERPTLHPVTWGRSSPTGHSGFTSTNFCLMMNRAQWTSTFLSSK